MEKVRRKEKLFFVVFIPSFDIRGKLRTIWKVTFSGTYSFCQDFPSIFLHILERLFFVGPTNSFASIFLFSHAKQCIFSLSFHYYLPPFLLFHFSPLTNKVGWQEGTSISFTCWVRIFHISLLTIKVYEQSYSWKVNCIMLEATTPVAFTWPCYPPMLRIKMKILI